jgi:hypothetical protein
MLLIRSKLLPMEIHPYEIAVISFIMQTLNEEKQIQSTIHELRALVPPAHEIIVVDGGSRDRWDDRVNILCDKRACCCCKLRRTGGAHQDRAAGKTGGCYSSAIREGPGTANELWCQTSNRRHTLLPPCRQYTS